MGDTYKGEVKFKSTIGDLKQRLRVRILEKWNYQHCTIKLLNGEEADLDMKLEAMPTGPGKSQAWLVGVLDKGASLKDTIKDNRSARQENKEINLLCGETEDSKDGSISSEEYVKEASEDIEESE